MNCIDCQIGCQMQRLTYNMLATSRSQAVVAGHRGGPKNDVQHFIIARDLLKGYVKIGAWE